MTDMVTKMREVLDKSLEVFYTKNVETNRKREEDKKKTIKWIIEGIMDGPIAGGVQGSDTQDPEYSWTFGSGVWEGEKKCIIIRDPVCRICGKNPAVEVHHIRPKHLKGSPTNPRNLIGLCLDCHDEVHRRIDQGIKQVISDSLDIKPPTIHTDFGLDRFTENGGKMDG